MNIYQVVEQANIVVGDEPAGLLIGYTLAKPARLALYEDALENGDFILKSTRKLGKARTLSDITDKAEAWLDELLTD